jgi:hypothetical protein
MRSAAWRGRHAYLLTAACLVGVLGVPQEGWAQHAARFLHMQADQLTAVQKNVVAMPAPRSIHRALKTFV